MTHMYFCCRGHEAPICILDNIFHALHIPCRWVCDTHDRFLLR